MVTFFLVYPLLLTFAIFKIFLTFSEVPMLNKMTLELPLEYFGLNRLTVE